MASVIAAWACARAAEAMGLDFIGLTWERFDLAIPRRRLETDAMQALA